VNALTPTKPYGLRQFVTTRMLKREWRQNPPVPFQADRSPVDVGVAVHLAHPGRKHRQIVKPNDRWNVPSLRFHLEMIIPRGAIGGSTND